MNSRFQCRPQSKALHGGQFRRVVGIPSERSGVEASPSGRVGGAPRTRHPSLSSRGTQQYRPTLYLNTASLVTSHPSTPIGRGYNCIPLGRLILSRLEIARQPLAARFEARQLSPSRLFRFKLPRLEAVATVRLVSNVRSSSAGDALPGPCQETGRSDSSWPLSTCLSARL